MAIAARQWRAARPYLLAVFIYLCSRLIIVLAISFAGTYLPLWKNDLWQSGARWYDHLLRWDSEWFAGIAENGYRYNGGPNDLQPVAFFPFYPLVSRLVASIPGIGATVALLLVANVAAIFAVLLFFRLARRHVDDDTALFAVALLSFYPGSLFLSAGYSEPLALALILCCFALLERARYVAAAVAAALALATRFVAIALLPVLLWELWRKFHGDRRRFAVYAVVCMTIASAGLWLYMLYLGTAFGYPLAFADAQAAFNGNTSLGNRLVAALTLEPLTRLRFTDFSPAGLDQWFFGVLLALTGCAWWRFPASLALFSLAALLVPYVSLSGGPSGLTSMTRFGVLAFPAFIMLALLCRRWPALGLATIGLFGAILGLHAALFAQWYWVG